MDEMLQLLTIYFDNIIEFKNNENVNSVISGIAGVKECWHIFFKQLTLKSLYALMIFFPVSLM